MICKRKREKGYKQIFYIGHQFDIFQVNFVYRRERKIYSRIYERMLKNREGKK